MYACNRGISSIHFERNYSLAFQIETENGLETYKSDSA